MTSDMEKKLQELLDKQAITECLYRYGRGIDRLDRELLMSVYHADALDDHGLVVGSREEFADVVFAHHGKNQVTTTHMVGNINIDLRGDLAFVESYYIYSGQNPEPPNVISTGRYVDRFEKRNGEWRIAHRTCVSENRVSGGTGVGHVPHVAKAADRKIIAQRNRNDVSYKR